MLEMLSSGFLRSSSRSVSLLPSVFLNAIEAEGRAVEPEEAYPNALFRATRMMINNCTMPYIVSRHTAEQGQAPSNGTVKTAGLPERG
jgi:hypothetical protein